MMERVRLETADGSHSLYVPALNETYHSRHGALQESRHVFIDMGLRRVAARQRHIRILEVGFGTGLNALLTALEAAAMDLEVAYWTVEAYPLAPAELEGLNYAALIGDAAATSTWNALHAAPWEEMQPVSPGFHLQKIAARLEDATWPADMDLVYFDAFAPEKQPELWTAPIFERIQSRMKPSALLTTYCAKGVVRRTLQSVGFQVSRVPGPPGKREMIIATK